jgi:hypothetical protein
MHVNARIDDKKAKAAKRAALDHDHAGWPDILDRALDLYIERYGTKTPVSVATSNPNASRME